MSSFSVKNFLSTFSVKSIRTCLVYEQCYVDFSKETTPVCTPINDKYSCIIECIFGVGWPWDCCDYWFRYICIRSQFPKEKSKKENLDRLEYQDSSAAHPKTCHQSRHPKV